jgi:hypothetical protein
MKYFSIIAAFIVTVSPSYVESADGAPFSVKGERLDMASPDGWKLAWQEGDQDGQYFVEYIPENENIHSWKNGYLMIVRRLYPPPEIMKEINEANNRVADFVLMQNINAVQRWCPDNHEPMSLGRNTFNGIYFAVSGGYCSLSGENRPFGEGAFTIFAEGKDFFYEIRYGWRPQSKEEQKVSPWGIDKKTAQSYLESIKSVTLCDEGKANCKNLYK